MKRVDMSSDTYIIQLANLIYNKYSHLLEAYNLDFFVLNHWTILPKCWQTFLEEAAEEDFANLLDYECAISNKVCPLSILALRSLLKRLCIPRKYRIVEGIVTKATFETDQKLMKLFWRNIKLKKRHEISIMAKVCHNNAVKANCMHIVDIGSGLGHLSRLLCYGYNLNVCTFEAQVQLCEQARKLDIAFEDVLKSKNISNEFTRTCHVNMKIEPNLTPDSFFEMVKKYYNNEDDNFQFGIVGLHPCGDLGAVLLRLYAECKHIRFINLASCCYMKLNTSCIQGYPVSNFCKKNNYNLTYHSREIACHAIENYGLKLREDKEDKLKIHSFRAALEKILVSLDSNLKHSALCNIKYSKDLTFEKYCEKAVSKLDIQLSKEQINSAEIIDNLKDWKKVVAFYCIRLMFAPLIETIILLDRLIYLEESGTICEIIPAFDPLVSSRNHIISSRKLE